MRALSKKQKLYVVTIIIACGLIFYGLGIATNFFGQPMFSMFWIISDSTAHNVVTYVAVAAGIALTMGVTLSLIKKRKSTFPEAQNKPVNLTIKASNEAPVIIAHPINSQKITNNPESYKTEQKNQYAKKPIIQPTKRSTTKIPMPTNTAKNLATHQETVANKDRITCPTCKNEFSTPLFSLDYNSGNLKSKLLRLCPYCNQTLEETKTTEEEVLWNKYVQKT